MFIHAELYFKDGTVRTIDADDLLGDNYAIKFYYKDIAYRDIVVGELWWKKTIEEQYLLIHKVIWINKSEVLHYTVTYNDADEKKVPRS